MLGGGGFEEQMLGGGGFEMLSGGEEDDPLTVFIYDRGQVVWQFDALVDEGFGSISAYRVPVVLQPPPLKQDLRPKCRSYL
jgi:hypothetical protein